MRGFRLAGAMLALTSLMSATTVQAVPSLCSAPSRDGDVTLGNGIVNTYYAGTGNPGTGTASITIGAADSRGATTPIAVGDLLLVIQIQGASITSTNSTSYGGTSGSSQGGRGYNSLGNAGNYEYVRAGSNVSAAGGTLLISGGLSNAYTTGNPSTSNTARSRYQVVRVPQYRNAVLSGTITALAWNGATGGIVAFDVANALTFSGGGINVNALGFRGGGGVNSTSGSAFASLTTPDYATSQSNNAAHGSKGEGIGGTPLRVYGNGTVTTLSATELAGALGGARGAPGNAGGGGTDGNPVFNEQNAGGGGGSNGGQGGQGGYAWCGNFNSVNGCPQSGGLGGVPMPNAGKGDIFMGGGGGAGSMNNNTGEASGAPGGGIVMLRAGILAGSGTIAANGGSLTTGTTNDSTGGGGGGGSIQIFAQSRTGNISATARGGNGMSNTGEGASHGPGGGGGGGVIVSNVTLGTNVLGGSPGTTFPSQAYGANYGATSGDAGVVDTAYGSTNVPGKLYSGAECTPVVTKTFNSGTIPTGGVSRLTVTISNPNPTLSLTSTSVVDNLPNGTSVAQNPTGTTSCTTGSVTANAGAQAASISGATIAATASCTYSTNVTSSSNGTYVNTIPVGGVTGTMGGAAVTNAVPATASLTVTPGLTIAKSSRTLYDPYNILNNPKSIPGAYVQYSLTVSNPSSLPVTTDSVVLSDSIPSNTKLIVSPLYAQQAQPNARGPFQYLDGVNANGSAGTASGLSFVYNSLGDTTDSSDFSTDGSTFGYAPTPDGNFTDVSVKAVQFRMFGTMAPNSVFTVNFLVRID